MNHTKYKKIRNVLAIILFLNFVVALSKIIIGMFMDSQSVLADGYHSISDGSSNIVGLIAIYLSSKPADENHPYGHGKFETLFSLIIVVFLGFVGYGVLVTAIKSIENPSTIIVSNLGIFVMSTTLIINIFVASYEKKQGAKLKSLILSADAKHTLADIYVTISVLFSIIGIKYFNLPSKIDSYLSIAVALIIFKTAFEILIEVSKTLTDTAVLDHYQIENIVEQFNDVKECHLIKSRGTEAEAFLDFHILVDEEMSVRESHDLTDKIEEKIQKEFNMNIEILIHIEPYIEKYVLKKNNEGKK